MARTLSTNFHLGIKATYADTRAATGESGTTVTQTDGGFLTKTTFATGTSASQAERMWSSKARAIDGGADETIDIYDLGSLNIGTGAGLDALGEAITFSGIKGIYIENISGSAGSLIVGNDGTTAAWNSLFSASDTASITLAPGAVFCYMNPTAAGLAVTDTSNHLLKMAASGGSLTYNIVLIGID